MVSFHHEPGTPRVTARDGLEVVAYLRWWPPTKLGGTHRSPVITPYELEVIEVRPDYRRRGIASMLFDYTKTNVEPRLKHSQHMTTKGAAWAKAHGYTFSDYTHVPTMRSIAVWSDD